MIRKEDIAELGYGGAVTLGKWWDSQRITEGKLVPKDVHKSAEFYAYVVPGVIVTAASAMGWMRRYEDWFEHASHGFLYAFPGFVYDLTKKLSASGGGTRSDAVRQAQDILRRQQASQQAAQGQLTQGRSTDRSYQREFQEAVLF